MEPVPTYNVAMSNYRRFRPNSPVFPNSPGAMPARYATITHSAPDQADHGVCGGAVGVAAEPRMNSTLSRTSGDGHSESAARASRVARLCEQALEGALEICDGLGVHAARQGTPRWRGSPAGLHAAGLKPAAEADHALLRRPMRPALRVDGTPGVSLKIVADRGRGRTTERVGALPRTLGSSSTGWPPWSRPRAGIAIGITACSPLRLPPCRSDRAGLPMAGSAHDAPSQRRPKGAMRAGRPATSPCWLSRAMLLARIL
jgi:hypothetical protein